MAPPIPGKEKRTKVLSKHITSVAQDKKKKTNTSEKGLENRMRSDGCAGRSFPSHHDSGSWGLRVG